MCARAGAKDRLDSGSKLASPRRIDNALSVQAGSAEVFQCMVGAINQVFKFKPGRGTELESSLFTDCVQGTQNLVAHIFSRFTIDLKNSRVFLNKGPVLLFDAEDLPISIEHDEVDLAVHSRSSVLPAPMDTVEYGVVVRQRVLQERERFDLGLIRAG